MTKDGGKTKNCIVGFLILIVIFILSGIYTELDNLILLSIFFPIVFIPLVLLVASKGLYTQTKGLVFLAATFSPLIFFMSIILFRTPEALKLPNIGELYIVILLLSFLVSYFIHFFSYGLIRFFGIQIDEKIIENVKTISYTSNDATEGKDLIKFFLTEILGFDYVSKNISNLEKFQRSDGEYVLLRYTDSKESPNLLLSYIMFYDDQDGVKAFNPGLINSFSLILEKLLGGKNVVTPEEVKAEYNHYFSTYTPTIARVHEHFTKSQLNWRDLKNPILLLGGVIFIVYSVYNMEKITQFISSLDTDTVVKIAAVIVALPTSVYYILKILGKVK